MLLALIAIYVPVAGAGPSIQRAGVMGAAGLVATLASRPSSRWHALLLAVAITLAINPRAAGDVGWQLSFAAVIGILLWCAGLASPARRRRARDRASAARLAEGVAVTAAATVATAPLMAHHFDSFSLAALPANLLALPAVAPAMWLGMLSAFAAPGARDSGRAAQLAQLALPRLHRPGRSLARLAGLVAGGAGHRGAGGVACAYLGLIALAEAGLAAARRRRGLGLGGRASRPPRPGRRAALAAAMLAAAGLLGAPALVRPRAGADSDGLVVTRARRRPGRRDPARPAGRTSDAGRHRAAGSGIGGRLRDLGVERLAAVAVTHPDRDHAGGLAEVMGASAVERLLLARSDDELLGAATAEGARAARQGGRGRRGPIRASLRLSALWPPAPRPRLPGLRDERPQRPLAGAAGEWRHFSMLLTGDAEAEAVPLDPGPGRRAEGRPPRQRRPRARAPAGAHRAGSS